MPPLPGRRQRAAAAVLAAVLLAHGLLLSALPREPTLGPGRAAGRVLHVQARIVAPTMQPRPTPPARPGHPVGQDRQAGLAPAPAARRAPATATATATATPTVAAPAPAPALAPASSAAVSAPSPGDDTVSAAALAAEPGGLSLPLYAVQLPAAATLHYTLQRGGAVGTARLHWQPGAGRYALALESQLAGRPALGWASEGAIDAHGVAPERYVESRRGRAQRAANFERASGRIRFSGTQAALALHAGAQDRLSWLLQLAGVLAADPALAVAGQSITLFVAGARGEGRPWAFRVMGAEALALPGGTLRTLRLRREPEHPYDTLAEVWLDPARGHLPVRLRWQAPPAPEATELSLQAPDAPRPP